jgi:methylmalonyl-CoA/ethylmalonyl-CoA epimerase
MNVTRLHVTRLHVTRLHVTRLHHVAFTEHGTEVTDALQRLFGLTVAHTEAAEGFIERMLPAGLAGQAKPCFLQALQPTGPGVVQQAVQRRGTGLHHIALQVDDVAAALSELAAAGAQLVDPVPRPGGMGTLIGFVHPKSVGGVLVELVQEGATP